MVRVAIVGLGTIGGSLGLALQGAQARGQVKGEGFRITGYDADPKALREARQRGVVHNITESLEEAVAGADLVILSAPARAVGETLQALGPLLSPGCIITDTASSKAQVLCWAAQYLPPEVSFVGGHPILAPQHEPDWSAGVRGANADLFQDAIYCLIPAANTPERAINTVSGMVRLIGASPYFLDAAEHDGLLAGISHVPHLVAAALLQTIAASPSWRELKLLADPSFRHLSWPVSFPVSEIYDACLTNRQAVLSWLDRVIASLQGLRASIADETAGAEEIVELFERAGAARRDWVQRRDEREGEAGSTTMPEIEGMGEQVMHMFVPRFFRRRPEKEE
ncbi:MAG: prephenate dehydrogenase [Chloroflexia bacterium]